RLEPGGLVEFLEATAATFDLFVAADVLVYVGMLERGFDLVRRRSVPGALFAFSTEIDETGDVRLTPTGRYGHGEGHVRRTAAAAGWAVLASERHPLRREGDEPVVGNCVVLQAVVAGIAGPDARGA